VLGEVADQIAQMIQKWMADNGLML